MNSAASKIREHWMNLCLRAQNDPAIAAIFDDPEIQQQALDALGVAQECIPIGITGTHEF